MSWITDNAIKRIVNVYNRSKDKWYNEDIKALKILNEELINSQKNYVNDNILFAKLLAIHLKCEVDYYKDINFAKKNIHSALKEPLGFHIEKLKNSLTYIDFENYGNSIGLDFNFVDTEDSRVKNKEIINDNQKELIEKLKKVWSFEKVEQSIYNTANEFLKDIENYKL